MKKTVVLAAMMFTSSVASANSVADQFAHEIGASFEQDPKTKAWVPINSSVVDGVAKCKKTLARLADMGVPETHKVTLQNDTAELVKGEYTIADLLPICERVAAFAKTKKWQGHAFDAFTEFPKVGPKTVYNETIFENCIKEYDKMMKAGVPPTYRVPEQSAVDANLKPTTWGGATVEELRKKWCDQGLKNAKAETEKRDAPYKKALKGDQLALALTWRSVWLPGGQVTSDPKAMAKSRVWFTDAFPGLVCLKKGVPEVHELTRYEFDGAGKMVRQSSTKYCGDPPASAFK